VNSNVAQQPRPAVRELGCLSGVRFVKILRKAGNIKKFAYDADLLARFDFAGRIGQDSFPCVSPQQQSKFQADFVSQFKKVFDQLNKYRWLSADAPLPPRVISGPYQPRTDLHVFISEMYDLSRSLVPSWSGQRGWMEFPAHRIVVGEAAIAHELVHVLFPNGNRMLAEGLAVYLQQKLFPRLPVYPNYSKPLEEVVQNFLRTTFPDSPSDALWNMDLEGLASISTPDDVYIRVGERPFIGGDPGNPNSPPVPHEVKFVYAVAGSLVAFLLENPVEDSLLTESNFGALYQSTPLRPLERDSGAPDRWQQFYKGKTTSYSFKDLSLLWKTYMHFILFGGEKVEIPIPDKYRKVELVAELYGRLKGIEGQASAKSAAAKPQTTAKASKSSNNQRR
jgi:hypothetical protein